MRLEALNEARDWIDRAEVDLQLAERALRIPPPLAGGGHTMLNRRPRRGSRRSSPRTTNLIRLTHNLAVLLPLCEAIDATFSQFAAASRSLTPYATEFRYPGGPLDPAMTDAEEGLRDAAEIVGLVRQKLSF